MTRLSADFDAAQATRNLRGGDPFSAPVPPPIPVPASAWERPCYSADPNGRDVRRMDLARDDLTGFTLGQYELGPKIGEGGMGAVFIARHVRLDKQFAVKFIADDVAEMSEAQARFDQEILALGKLRHPNIVSAVDAGCRNELKYLVTEFVDGQDFARLVDRHGALTVANACELIRQTAVGLAYSHRAGFLHRDIKPSNLILDRSGIVKILDFGLVSNGAKGGRLTDSGQLIGTLDFIAPEQAEDASRVDERSDLYSLGCTFIYLLSGRPPFDDLRYSSLAAKLKGHLFDRPDWFDRVPNQIPKKLVALLERMTAKETKDRIKTAEEVAEALIPFVAKADFSVFQGVATPTVPTELETESVNTKTDGGRLRKGRWWLAACGIFGGILWIGYNPQTNPKEISSSQHPEPPATTEVTKVITTAADTPATVPAAPKVSEEFLAPPTQSVAETSKEKLPEIVDYRGAPNNTHKPRPRRPHFVHVPTW